VGQRQIEERTRVVRDGALHRETTVGANREWHESLAGWRILGGERSNRKAGEIRYGGPFWLTFLVVVLVKVRFWFWFEFLMSCNCNKSQSSTSKQY
jgi:hypothetical protein